MTTIAEAPPNDGAGTRTAADFPDEIRALGDQIVALTVLEAKSLGDYLQDTYGIEPPQSVMMQQGPPQEEEEEEAKSEFNVVLTGFEDGKKIQVIKEVRQITQLSLKEAKEFVEGTPSTLKEALSEGEAEELKAKLVAVGGKVELK